MSDYKYPRVVFVQDESHGIGQDFNHHPDDRWVESENGTHQVVPVDAVVIERDDDGEWPIPQHPFRYDQPLAKMLVEGWPRLVREVMDAYADAEAALEAASKEEQ